MTEQELEELTKEGTEGYNKIVYRFIVEKDFKKAHEYADKKMNKILEDDMDMQDEDLALVAYTYAMNEDYETSEACLTVIKEDGDVMKEEEDLDIFGTVAALLCYKKAQDLDKVKALLKQTLSFDVNPRYQGADEALLNQVKELEGELLI